MLTRWESDYIIMYGRWYRRKLSTDGDGSGHDSWMGGLREASGKLVPLIDPRPSTALGHRTGSGGHLLVAVKWWN